MSMKLSFEERSKMIFALGMERLENGNIVGDGIIKDFNVNMVSEMIAITDEDFTKLVEKLAAEKKRREELFWKWVTLGPRLVEALEGLVADMEEDQQTGVKEGIYDEPR